MEEEDVRDDEDIIFCVDWWWGAMNAHVVEVRQRVMKRRSLLLKRAMF